MNYKIISRINFSLLILAILFIYFSYIHDFASIQTVNILISASVFIFYLFTRANDLILFKLIIYLMFFDINDLFTFGGVYNFRIWYFVVVYLLVKDFLNETKYRENRYNLKNVTLCILVVTIALVSVFINGSKIDGLLFIVRLLFFYFTALYLFIKYLKQKKEMIGVLHFFTSMALFSSLVGIIQMCFLFFGIDILFSTGTMRPQAFFSETTWYSEYANIGILIALVLKFNNNNLKFFVIFIHIVAIILSMTRNSILGLILIIFYIVFVRKNKSEIVRLLLLLFVGVIGYSLILSKNSNLIGFDFIFNKFNLTDDSALGRLGAISANIEYLSNLKSFFWGSGFSYTDSNDLSGSAIGAKSFNLILAIFSSGGLFLFIIFVHVISKLYLKYINNKEKTCFNTIGIIILTIYFMYSMFAPFHFYPLSWFVLAISILMISYEEKKEC